MGHRDDPQAEMSDAEVMTTAIVAMLYYGGNYAKARKQLGCRQYIPLMLGMSYNRAQMKASSPVSTGCPLTTGNPQTEILK